MTEKIVSPDCDISTIFEEIEAFIKANAKSKNRENKSYFRGQKSKSWKCEPTLFRQLNHHLESLGNNYKHVENAALNYFHRQVVGLGIQRDNSKHFEQVARHHGLPSSLLDITSDPIFALWIATNEDDDDNDDGVVYQFIGLRSLRHATENSNYLPKIVNDPNVQFPLVTKAYQIHPRVSSQTASFIRFETDPKKKVFESWEGLESRPAL